MRRQWMSGLLLVIAGAQGFNLSQAYAMPLNVRYFPGPSESYQCQAVHYRRVGIGHRNPWQAPYHVSRLYRGGPGAEMGLVAQGILHPPHHSYFYYPGFYWNNYFYYPNYRMIYDF